MNKYIRITLIVAGIAAILGGLAFAYRQQKNNSGTTDSKPYLNSISPTGLPQGSSADIVLRVHGRNFTEKSVINWNGVAMPTNVENVKLGILTTNISSSYFANYGDYPVTVTNELSETSNALNFTVLRSLDDLLKNSGRTAPNNAASEN